METQRIPLEKLYAAIKSIQRELDYIKEKIEKEEKEELFLADEKLLAEDWMSEEDKKAWKDL